MSITVYKDAAVVTLNSTTPTYTVTAPTGKRILYAYARTYDTGTDTVGAQLLGDASHDWDSSGQTYATFGYPYIPYGTYYILWVFYDV